MCCTSNIIFCDICCFICELADAVLKRRCKLLSFFYNSIQTWPVFRLRCTGWAKVNFLYVKAFKRYRLTERERDVGLNATRGSAVLPAWTTALSLLDERMLTSVVTPRAVNSTESASVITRDSTIICGRYQIMLVNILFIYLFKSDRVRRTDL